MTIGFPGSFLLMFLAALGAGFPAALGAGQLRGDVGGVLPQVRPIVVWLTAVKNSDQETMKTAFSESMRRQFDRDGWESAMRTYQQVFTKQFGDYRVEEFAFEFEGDERRGTVSIAFKGRTLPGLRVVNENNAWKMDER